MGRASSLVTEQGTCQGPPSARPGSRAGLPRWPRLHPGFLDLTLNADTPEGCALSGPLGKSWGMSLLSRGHQPVRPSQDRTAKGCGAEDGQ